MKRPKLRARKAALVTPELCELFRKAIPYNQALWRDVVSSRRVLTYEQHVEALDACRAFNMAIGLNPLGAQSTGPRHWRGIAGRAGCQSSHPGRGEAVACSCPQDAASW